MKKTVSLLLAVIFVFALAVSVYAASGDTIVYCTSSGTKYHKEGCSSFKDNGIAISLQEAVDKGLTPCSKCNPPTLDAESAASASDSSAAETAAASVTAASVAAVEAPSGSSRHISPVLTFFIGLIVGAVAMVIVYRKFAPAVLAAQAEAEEAEAETEETAEE